MTEEEKKYCREKYKEFQDYMETLAAEIKNYGNPELLSEEERWKYERKLQIYRDNLATLEYARLEGFCFGFMCIATRLAKLELDDLYLKKKTEMSDAIERKDDCLHEWYQKMNALNEWYKTEFESIDLKCRLDLAAHLIKKNVSNYDISGFTHLSNKEISEIRASTKE